MSPAKFFLLAVLAIVAAVLAGCAHVDETTPKPVRGIVLDPDGHPVAGAQVWVTISMPGGFFAPQQRVASGPAYTGRDGRFSLALKPVRMVQTGSVFDGSVSPDVLVLHRRLGGIGTTSMKEEKDPGFFNIQYDQWPHAALESARGMADELPEPERTAARNYLDGKK